MAQELITPVVMADRWVESAVSMGGFASTMDPEAEAAKWDIWAGAEAWIEREAVIGRNSLRDAFGGGESELASYAERVFTAEELSEGPYSNGTYILVGIKRARESTFGTVISEEVDQRMRKALLGLTAALCAEEIRIRQGI
jgi:hypothetical protein